MIICCSRCAMGFALPDEALGKAGRRVRCGGCGHVWLQTANAGPLLDSPVTMEPAQAVISDAPGSLPPDLLEVDSPIGPGALSMAAKDPVGADAGEEYESAGEEVLTLDTPAEEAAEVEEEEPPAEDEDAEPAAASPAVAVPAPAKPGAIPEAWRASNLAALAPLVAAIAADKARAADAALEGAALETAAPSAPGFVPDDITAPELALLAATTLAPPGDAEDGPVASGTIELPAMEIPEPESARPVMVALRDERAKESDSVDAIALPPEPVIDDDLRPEDAIAPEIAAASLRRHRRLRYGAVMGALALIAGGLVANEVTQPDNATLLAAIETGGATADSGLGFVNVTTQRTAVGGVPMLVVTGEVVNESNRPRAVPPLRGSLLGGENELQFWTFTAAQVRLDPGQRASFETVLRNPAAGATDVRVTFATPGY